MNLDRLEGLDSPARGSSLSKATSTEVTFFVKNFHRVSSSEIDRYMAASNCSRDDAIDHIMARISTGSRLLSPTEQADLKRIMNVGKLSRKEAMRVLVIRKEISALKSSGLTSCQAITQMIARMHRVIGCKRHLPDRPPERLPARVGEGDQAVLRTARPPPRVSAKRRRLDPVPLGAASLLSPLLPLSTGHSSSSSSDALLSARRSSSLSDSAVLSTRRPRSSLPDDGLLATQRPTSSDQAEPSPDALEIPDDSLISSIARRLPSSPPPPPRLTATSPSLGSPYQAQSDSLLDITEGMLKLGMKRRLTDPDSPLAKRR